MSEFDSFLLMLLKSMKSVKSMMKILFSSHDLSVPDAICLRFIGCHPEGISAAELCSLICYDKALISRICHRLRAKGYIRINPKDEAVQRGYRFVLSQKGREQVSQMNKIISEYIEKFTDGIARDDLEVFCETSVKLSGNINKSAAK